MGVSALCAALAAYAEEKEEPARSSHCRVETRWIFRNAATEGLGEARGRERERCLQTLVGGWGVLGVLGVWVAGRLCDTPAGRRVSQQQQQ